MEFLSTFLPIILYIVAIVLLVILIILGLRLLKLLDKVDALVDNIEEKVNICLKCFPEKYVDDALKFICKFNEKESKFIIEN